MWTGRTVDAAEAERIGLANRVVAPEALAKEAEALAQDLAAAAPIPVALTKSLINREAELSIEASLEHPDGGTRAAVAVGAEDEEPRIGRVRRLRGAGEDYLRELHAKEQEEKQTKTKKKEKTRAGKK